MDVWPAEAKLNKVPETRLEALGGGTLLEAVLLDPIEKETCWSFWMARRREMRVLYLICCQMWFESRSSPTAKVEYGPGCSCRMPAISGRMWRWSDEPSTVGPLESCVIVSRVYLLCRLFQAMEARFWIQRECLRPAGCRLWAAQPACGTGSIRSCTCCIAASLRGLWYQWVYVHWW